MVASVSYLRDPMSYPHEDAVPDLERRGLERRTEMLERQTNQLTSRVIVLEVKVDAVITQMKSNFDALHNGQEMIAAKLNHVLSLKELVIGGGIFAATIGVTGIIGGVIAIIKMLKGP